MSQLIHEVNDDEEEAEREAEEYVGIFHGWCYEEDGWWRDEAC